MTLGSGWNIPIDLIIGPHVGISYVTHPQAKPIRVTDFDSVERISTSLLPTSTPKNTADANNGYQKAAEKGSSNGHAASSGGSPMSNKRSDSPTACDCNEIKTLLKIKVAGNADDLAITCNGIRTAESIADLVDGYCRIVTNTEISRWDRSSGKTPIGSTTNSLEKQKQRVNLSPQLPAQNPLHLPSTGNVDSAAASAASAMDAHGSANVKSGTPILNDDYMDVRLGEEEGDYSTPATRNYELDRSQITLKEIIGVGQFGDVHIGTCCLSKIMKPSSNGHDASQIEEDGEARSGDDDESKVIHVAVKTCKADADMITSEKFLEEACKTLCTSYATICLRWP